MARTVQPPLDVLDYIKKLEERIAALERSQRIGQTGLNRPFLPYRVIPSANLTTPPLLTTSSTFQALHTISGYIQNFGIKILLQVKADAGTTGEVRLYETTFATQLALASVTDGFDGQLLLTDGVALPALLAFDGLATLEVQARRVSGTGNVRVEVRTAYGRNVV